MDLPALTTFFKWCTIFGGGLLIFWSLCLMFLPDLVYRSQSRFFPMTRETWNVVIYSFLGLFKIIVIAFCLIPWLALLIMGT